MPGDDAPPCASATGPTPTARPAPPASPPRCASAAGAFFPHKPGRRGLPGRFARGARPAAYALRGRVAAGH